ncbi:hypothetical protein COLO4_02608 [Corchorus olitorius]|uniref:Uncharacterized protein n=1 Tax=Corchorus olitorius TaxID=93759 RepID=A0A1R3L0P8_9ROSI|nr:hypothetical protein COLO4_02608 [Corchorus olitorius]
MTILAKVLENQQEIIGLQKWEINGSLTKMALKAQ